VEHSARHCRLAVLSEGHKAGLSRSDCMLFTITMTLSESACPWAPTLCGQEGGGIRRGREREGGQGGEGKEGDMGCVGRNGWS
jgi:hypothetical protein